MATFTKYKVLGFQGLIDQPGAGASINITGASNPATAPLEMGVHPINTNSTVDGRDVGDDGAAQDFLQDLIGEPAGTNQLPLIPAGAGAIIPAGTLVAQLAALKLLADMSGGVGVTNFLTLNDTPASFTGQGLSFSRVNAAADALEFFPAPDLTAIEALAGTGLLERTGPATFLTRTIGLGADNIAAFDANRSLVIPDGGNDGQFWFIGEDGGQNLVFRYGANFAGSTVRFMMPVGLGSVGQVLTATATGTQWAASPSGSPDAFRDTAQINTAAVTRHTWDSKDFLLTEPVAGQPRIENISTEIVARANGETAVIGHVNEIADGGTLAVPTATRIGQAFGVIVAEGGTAATVGAPINLPLISDTAQVNFKWNGATWFQYGASTSGATLPTTTKGDISVHDGTTDIRLPVGTDDQVLVGDSTTASGLAYSTRVLTAANAAARDALSNVRRGQIVDVADDDGNGLGETYLVLTSAATFSAAGVRRIGKIPTFDAGGGTTIPTASAESSDVVRLINHSTEPDQLLLKLGDNSAYALTATPAAFDVDSLPAGTGPVPGAAQIVASVGGTEQRFNASDLPTGGGVSATANNAITDDTGPFLDESEVVRDFDSGGGTTLPTASATSPRTFRLINNSDPTLNGKLVVKNAANTAYEPQIQAFAAANPGMVPVSQATNDFVAQNPRPFLNISIPVGFAGKIRFKLPFDATLVEAFDLVDSGSFDYTVDIGGTDVGGLIGISVNSTAETPRTASTPNAGTGNQVGAITVSNNSSAVNGFIALRFQQSGLYV